MGVIGFLNQLRVVFDEVSPFCCIYMVKEKVPISSVCDSSNCICPVLVYEVFRGLNYFLMAVPQHFRLSLVSPCIF